MPSPDKIIETTAIAKNGQKVNFVLLSINKRHKWDVYAWKNSYTNYLIAELETEQEATEYCKMFSSDGIPMLMGNESHARILAARLSCQKGFFTIDTSPNP